MVNNNTTSETNGLFCGQGVDDFHTGYLPIHGYLSLIVCIFGCFANSLNIIVLTRREMRSPTNAILTGLAIADLLVMFDYIPYAFNGYILPQLNYPREKIFSYSWTWFVMFHSIFAQICHTISIWLTVTLAVWRYIAIGHPQKNRIWCGMHTTLIAIASSYIICPFIAIPLYLTFSISPVMVTSNEFDEQILINDTHRRQSDPTTMQRNITLYKMTTSDLANNHKSLMDVNFWIYSVVIKLIPCVALTILSLRLIGALLEAKRRRKQLTSNAANALKMMSNGKAIEKTPKNSKTLEKEKQTDRTTRMLLAVLLLFLITEFPQGILGLLSAVLGNKFFMECYLKLGDFMDILALINSSINFILYCSMSRQFRTTFGLLFRPKFLEKWLPVSQREDDNNLGRTDGGGGGCGGRDNNGHTTQITHV